MSRTRLAKNPIADVPEVAQGEGNRREGKWPSSHVGTIVDSLYH